MFDNPALFSGSVGGGCMAKCFRTIYFEAEIYLEAEKQKLDFNSVCNEAVRLALNLDKNEGTTAGALGNFLNHEVERKKDFEIVRKLRTKNIDKYNQGVKILMEKYHLEFEKVVNETQ